MRHEFTAEDGITLAWHETGSGRAVLLLHGLFSNAHTNWIRYGHADLIASRGFRVIMPDLRGHGTSDRPHDPAAYPSDILAHDGLALVAHLGLTDYDLGGYSLGGRTSMRMLLLGAAPRQLICAGMGLQGLLDTQGRADHFKAILDGLGTHPRGSPEWLAEAFLKTTGGDARALRLLLDSFVDTRASDLARILMPTMVLTGVDDQDNGSAEALAEALPDARYVEIPGNHMSAVLKPELGRAIADFLDR